ncbi:MAG: 1,4-alpha-glucan branching protein GlgB [Planctomycetota bacterium]
MERKEGGIPEQDLYLFNHGELKRAWRVLGAHVVEGGVRFAVWAPHARRVSVVGDFNDWQPRRLDTRASTGVWEGVVEGAKHGDHYKYELIDSNGHRREKADPFAFRMEVRPKTASLVWDLSGHTWQDAAWMESRQARQAPDAPMRVYEVHLGSWRRGRGYRDLARELVDYVASLGFTHLELLPIAEHPYDASWGYQVCGYYAATSRYGTPQDLMALVDACHQAGIGVLVDWVPAHFPKDDHGLNRFDGSRLFEHDDPRRGVHQDWDTLIFNFGRPEVCNYLRSNALFWLDEFHVDGLRVDAVASMLYRDYSRAEGEWIPNELGGREDLEAIAFLRGLNDLVHAEAPGALTIAEESTAFPGVTQVTASGGLGFDLKWNMGWMHDSLAFLQKDPLFRKYHNDRLTFALYYAFHERYLLPLSHDEVVHLKQSLLAKMPGDEWQKLANLRLLHAWQAAHPGKSLLFMGGELGAWHEWAHDGEVDWNLLEQAPHAGLRLLVGDLNRLVTDRPCLHALDHDWRGFQWIDFADVEQSAVSFVRWGPERHGGLLFVFNFTPVVRSRYRVGAPRPGRYVEILNTDSACYGGSGVGNLGSVQAEAIGKHAQPHSLSLTLPPLGAVAFEVPPP